MNYTRTEAWRIKRSANHLDKALDSLTRAKGELRPIKELDARMGKIVSQAEDLYREMQNGAARLRAQRPGEIDDAEPADQD